MLEAIEGSNCCEATDAAGANAASSSVPYQVVTLAAAILLVVSAAVLW